MSDYTTGELATLCGVTVRTVQFYDNKELLKPSALTEGGRRLYSEQDLKKLRWICLLKVLGLSLSSIQELLRSKDQEKILLLLLEEQAKITSAEIEQRKHQLSAIETAKESIRISGVVPLSTIADIEHMMNDKKKLKKTHTIVLIFGILMDIIEAGTLVFWIMTGVWWPFAVGMLFVVLIGILLCRMYYRNAAYLCPECGVKFRPGLAAFFFSRHTPKTRNLTCSACGYTGFCVETASDGPNKPTVA